MANRSYISVNGKMILCYNYYIEPLMILFFRIEDKKIEKENKTFHYYYKSSATNALKNLKMINLDIKVIEKVVIAEFTDKNTLRKIKKYLKKPDNLRKVLEYLNPYSNSKISLPSYIEEFFYAPAEHGTFSIDFADLYLVYLILNNLRGNEIIEFDPNEIIYMDDDWERAFKSDYTYEYLINKCNLKLEAYAELHETLVLETGKAKEKFISKVEKLDENHFTDYIVIPLLRKIGFQHIRSIESHGPGEFGKDLQPFYKIDEFEKIRYYSAQIKTIRIQASTSKTKGNVNQIINQIKAGFRVRFLDKDGTSRYVKNMLLITPKNITSEAYVQLIEEFGDGIIIIDGKELINLIKKYWSLYNALSNLK